MKIIVSIILLLFLIGNAFADTYWVHPDGVTAWSGCKSETDPGENYCSVGTSTANADAGDTVYLKDGNYTLGVNYYGAIHFRRGGTNATTGRVIFSAAPGEHPLLKPTVGQTLVKGFYIGDTGYGPMSYIKIDGIIFKNFNSFGIITNGSTHNEITNCTFTSDAGISGAMVIWSLCGTYICPSTHNWIHHNTFSRAWGGGDCVEGADLLQIGIGYSSGRTVEDNYNTIENNYFASSGHGAVNSYGRYLVWKNNVMQNAPWHGGETGACGYSAEYVNEAYNGLYGHRNFQISDDYERGGIFNLVEDNRVGHASANPGNDGADNLDIAGPKNIVRYNYSYNAMSNGFVFKYADAISKGAGLSGSKNNRAYNNTIYRSGYGYSGSPAYEKKYGVYVYISYHNASCSSAGVPYSCCTGSGTGTCDPTDTGNVFKNNIVYDSNNTDFGGETFGELELITRSNNWCSGADTGCSATGDPLFTNTDISDPTSLTLPNLIPTNAAVRDGGTYLTLASGSGDNNVTLHVDGNDSLYFQDGTWGSDLARGVTLFPDWIAIGTVTNTVQISSIDYATNTITLASPMTWADDAPIWLYKKSDGAIVLYGSAPDYGAYEYNPATGLKGSSTGSGSLNMR